MDYVIVLEILVEARNQEQAEKIAEKINNSIDKKTFKNVKWTETSDIIRG